MKTSSGKALGHPKSHCPPTLARHQRAAVLTAQRRHQGGEGEREGDTPHAVTSSWGMGQTAIPESWRGARPGGWGQEAWRGTISPLSSISECIIYEPPHLGAPFAPRASKQVCNGKGRPL